MNSKYNKWVVKYEGVSESTNLKNMSIHPELEELSEYYLRCYFDEMGQNKFVLEKNDDSTSSSNHNWSYETPIGMDLPIQKP